MRDRGNQRRDNNHLRDDHRSRGEQQPEHPERAGSRQHHIDEQPHHHRRQPHQRIQHRNGLAAKPEAVDHQPCAQRQADQRGNQHRRHRHPQRQADNLQQVGVKREYQPESVNRALCNIVHFCQSVFGNSAKP